MKLSTILDHINSGHMALPEFQLGHVLHHDQRRRLINSSQNLQPIGDLEVAT